MDKTQLKVLIADDEDDILEFLSYNFKKEDFIVRTAKNGLDSILTAREFRPDIIILDIMMPGMDGFEILKKIK